MKNCEKDRKQITRNRVRVMQEPQKTLILSHSLRLQVPFDTNLILFKSHTLL